MSQSATSCRATLLYQQLRQQSQRSVHPLGPGNPVSSEATSSNKGSVGVKFVLACTYAQAAESLKRNHPTNDKWNNDQFRQKALASMQAALAADYHRPADLRYDPELAPIRSELSIAEL